MAAGFTTTPDERIGPGPPYTNSLLQVNLFFRVFLGLLAPMVCWVPMRLLWRNGEFSAAVLCVVIMTLNIFYAVNALIWHDDNVQDWFAGNGWCDLQAYTLYALETIYSGCVFAIMRNLANKVGLMRVSSLSRTEKKRRNIVEAFIIFPVAFLQVVLSYFILAQRYNVSTLVGCTASYDTSWPYLLFYLLPSPLYTFGSAIYAILTWKRFHDVERSTRLAVNTNNSSLVQRHQRVRRKLYLMALSILIPFFPMQLLFLACNFLGLRYPIQSYDFERIHYGQNPYPVDLVTFSTSDRVSFVNMNNNYVAVITVVPLFWFFGTTKEAINTYRRYLLSVGLGWFFPALHNEYDPDHSSSATTNYKRGRWPWSSQSFIKIFNTSDTGGNRAASTTASRSLKDMVLPSFHHVSLSSTTNSSSSFRRTSTTTNPWPEDDGYSMPTRTSAGHFHLPPRIPFVFRTALATPTRVHLPGHGCRTGRDADPAVTDSGTLLRPIPERHDGGGDGGGGSRPATSDCPWAGRSPGGAKVQTRVWSDDDGGEEGDRPVANGPAASGFPEGVRVETMIASTVTESARKSN